MEASIPAGPEIDDKTLEASIPAGPEIDDKTLEASLPAAKGELDEKSLGANKPAVKPQINVSLKANSSKPAPTTQAKKPGAKSETKVSSANKPKSAPTTDAKSKSQATSAAKPAGVTPTRGAQVASCPALVRAINAANPDQPSAVDIIVNGKKVLSNVPFSQASRYMSVSSGKLRVQIMKAGTKTMVGERTFAAAPNSAYSVAVTGPLQGPRGQVLFNKSPFVIPEDLSPPSPGKFKGGWYKLSETKAENDLRIAKSGAPNVAKAQLVDVIPKTAVDYSELKAGTYNFYTVLPNKSDTIVNKAYKPAIRVEIAKANIPAGTIFDVFAIGNTLGKGHNSLKLSAASYKTLPPTAAGCTKVQ